MSTSDTYDLRDRSPTSEEFVALRDAAGMAPRSKEGVERGLPNTLFGVVAIDESTGETVGMGRIVGDGGTVLVLSDIAVHPNHQGQGLGTQIVASLMEFVEREAPPRTYVSLMADVEGFYEQFGFEEGYPDVRGMYYRTE